MSRSAVLGLLAVAAVALPACVQAQGIIDGTYSGEAVMAQFSTGRGTTGQYNCPPGGPFRVLVKDGAFNLSWAGTIYTVNVKPDGTIDQAMGTNAHITGKVADGKLNAKAEGRVCLYTYKLSK